MSWLLALAWVCLIISAVLAILGYRNVGNNDRIAIRQLTGSIAALTLTSFLAALS